ncbi:hypothetical protein AB0D14_41235 [Streptomyces sp. NPDC048484]|uniref:hypothetical protein n=1 Tax=Streptomyces sp. NPDC048484 TaxID=3155146 RepID=UPI00343D4D8C
MLSVTTAAALTACGAGSEEDAQTNGDAKASASPIPAGAITAADAEKVVDAYEKANNEANKTQGSRGATLLGTVEAGQVHEQSLADYEQFKTWPKAEQAKYGKPFVYTSREYYIPDADRWFAVKATTTGSKSEGLLIFDKVGSRFKMVASVYTEDKTAIPEIAVQNGLATAVDPSKRVGTLAPNQLGTAFEDLVESGGKKEGQQLARHAGHHGVHQALHGPHQGQTGQLRYGQLLRREAIAPQGVRPRPGRRRRPRTLPGRVHHRVPAQAVHEWRPDHPEQGGVGLQRRSTVRSHGRVPGPDSRHAHPIGEAQGDHPQVRDGRLPMRRAKTSRPRTPRSLRLASVTADDWARSRDQRFALFLTKRLAESERIGCCLAELKALAGVQDVFAEWLTQRELSAGGDGDLRLDQSSTLGWALRSIAHSIWAGHPQWELAFHPNATRPPIDPIKTLAYANIPES